MKRSRYSEFLSRWGYFALRRGRNQIGFELSPNRTHVEADALPQRFSTNGTSAYGLRPKLRSHYLPTFAQTV